MGKKICAALGLDRVELSVVLTGDVEIQELNVRWRGKDKATDVLSFAQQEEDDFLEFPQVDSLLSASESAPQFRVIGDVVISLDTANMQANDLGLSLQEEIIRLLIHGILHLLGHDHVHGGHQAKKMRAEENRILAELGNAFPKMGLTQTPKLGNVPV